LEKFIIGKANYLKSSRPTTVNLVFAVDEMVEFIFRNKSDSDLNRKVLQKAGDLKDAEVEFSNKIGEYGLEIIEAIYRQKKQTVNILTHCNAGWLACIDWGTAAAMFSERGKLGIKKSIK